jgi:polysaccharide biosynthesis/export protein
VKNKQFLSHFKRGIRYLHGFFFLLALASCGGPYKGKEVCGADEFVLDSYRIKEGKFSILEMEGKIFSELPEDALDEYKDTIRDGDVLLVAVYHPKREDISRAVDAIGCKIGYMVSDGKIGLPDLEPVEVKGLTLNQAALEIQRKYTEEIKDIAVFVTYKERTIGRVELAGLVQVPTIPVDGKIRLFDVIAKAKIPVDANLFRSYVIRDNEPLSVDLYKLMKLGDMSQNIVMRSGDKVYIAEPASSTLMVMGEVGCERLLAVPHGYMSLREALAAAGGIPYTGDKSYIQIIRGSIVRPKIYTVNWEHVIHLPNDSLLLMPGDVVYVASKPITEWNRFISQLVPSFAGVNSVGSACSGWGLVVP